jgi:DNA mismatch repair protein MutL
MRDLIQLLPDAIANQIAAGEVVQRPASVVKELLENSIDAGASSIQLIIKDAGKGLIQVIDNGSGMSETDARMCFERHATSKIRKAEDLFQIKTMGFRGEAMASIASVAQIELKTKRAENEIGTAIRIEASVFKSQENISCSVGTSVSVKNLFYNIPARRNFLKSNPVEMRHILDEFQRVALAHPEIKFVLNQNGEELFNLPSEKLGKRIVDLFGKSYREQLAFCEEETSYVSIKGYVGKPENAKKTRGEQFFFVNNRFIKSTYLNHAVMAAYERLIPDGNFPFYVLFLEIDPSHIDINVHPTKTEIKFDDERSVYAIVHAAVRKTLSINHLIPSIDFETNTNFLQQISSANTTFPSSTSSPLTHENRTFSSKAVNESWKKLYDGLNDQIEQFENQKGRDSQDLFKQEVQFPTTLQSRANNISGEVNTNAKWSFVQITQGFIGITRPDGLLIIHQKRAYQRILFDQFIDTFTNKNCESQQLLFPETLQLNSGDKIIFLEIIDHIKNLGFDIAPNPDGTYSILGLPASLQEENPQFIIEDLLEQLKHEVTDFKQLHQEKLARIISNRAAAKFHLKYLAQEEMQQLIERLFASSNPNVSPNGDLISKLMDKHTIEQWMA